MRVESPGFSQFQHFPHKLSKTDPCPFFRTVKRFRPFFHSFHGPYYYYYQRICFLHLF